MNKLLASSVNPKQLSLTVKGILVGAVPLAMLVIQAAGSQITQDELQTAVIAVSDVVAAVGALASAVMVAVGVVRKVFAAFRE